MTTPRRPHLELLPAPISNHNPFAHISTTIQRVRNGMDTSSGLPPAISVPVGTIVECPKCNSHRTRCETTPNAMGRILAYWSECPCVVQQIDESERLTRQMEAQKREAERIQETAYDLQTLAKQGTMTLDTFRPEYLRTTTPEAHPLHIATDWLKAILRQQVVGSFRSGEVAALFFLGQPGRGKTHLAIALLLEAMRREHRAAFLNEAQYFDQRLTLPFDRLEELVSVPSERAWLTCFDDIGKLAPSDKKKQQSAQANWYRMLDKRYNLRRWTIFTSEKTIEELHKQGTFDDALAGRVHEMTRGKYIVFDGVNVRFREADL